ncbi:MAG TPA: cytoplasmic protein [Candidatus Andersenbacteria bacterium]|nr:MAG: cytoplasmic protein [Planctomycetes bacterium GWA2_40_7]HBE90564.1 cytoplasmic protein [Candidatus Andersenbacteria bacterium]
MADNLSRFDFAALVAAIRQVDGNLAAQAGRAVNISLTLRNWLIGAYIAEYELCGADRATYGESLLIELAEHLTDHKISNCNRRQLYRYLRFYRLYPKIVGTLSAQLRELLPASLPSSQAESHVVENVGTVPPQLQISPDQLIHRLSYSHLELIVDLDDDLKRAFYEIECIRGNWSVRELKRQIGSLYYERSGLSRDKNKLAELAQVMANQAEPKLDIRDPYIFEFLGIKPREVMRESDLEDALLDKLHDFLLELGHGFCFEARQKRILIGNTHGFVDMVFYHRILKCHVLVELKVESFTHENLGQLNTYVSWYRKNMMANGDNPPVGILLCTQKDHALVEYATAGMDNHLFVSKYQLELPKKEDIQRFLEEKMREDIGYGG